MRFVATSLRLQSRADSLIESDASTVSEMTIPSMEFIRDMRAVELLTVHPRHTDSEFDEARVSDTARL